MAGPIRRTLALVLGCLLATPVFPATKERLELRHVALDLPGPPARVLPTDLNGDGRTDLVVVVAYTEIQQIGENRIEDMIEFTRVIPTLFDRRQARAYLATPTGDLVLSEPPLELPVSVLSLELDAPGGGLVALTDDGIARVRFDPSRDDGESALRLEPLVEQRSVLSGTRRFYANLELVHDLDGDGDGDVLLPTDDGLAVYVAGPDGLTAGPGPRLRPAGGSDDDNGAADRWYPMPEVRSVDGDAFPDLVFAGLAPDKGDVDVFLGRGGGRFAPLREIALDCHDRGSDLRRHAEASDEWPWPEDVAALRDLDGDGRAELVVGIEQSRGDSFRKELKDAKKPISTYRFFDLDGDLAVERNPYFEMQVVGHTMEGFEDDDEVDTSGSPFRLEQFVDLDADGRQDLVTITLQFSIFQVIRILASKKLSIGVDFHIYAQQPDRSFREVPDLDLSEKLKFDLNNLKIGRFAQFAGDFDGDGLRDFVHLGRGAKVTVHRGRPGCRYPANPDLTIELDQEPASLDLVRIEDLDGDGRSDIRVTRPLPLGDPDVTAPARLDLYLSGEPR